MMRRSRLALWLTAFAVVNTASADDLSGVAIERDKLEQVEGACRAVLAIEYGIGADFEALALDLVVFDADGVIAERLAVDSRRLRPARPRSRHSTSPGWTAPMPGAS